MTNRKRGFTLIELLVVMAILGVLTVVGLGNFQSARLKARDAKRKADISTIAKSLEAYVNDHNAYPGSSDGKIACQGATICAWGSAFTDGQSIYSAELPDDTNTGWDYRYDSNGTTYTLYAALENTEDPAYEVQTGISCGSATCSYKINSPNKTN